MTQTTHPEQLGTVYSWINLWAAFEGPLKPSSYTRIWPQSTMPLLLPKCNCFKPITIPDPATQRKDGNAAVTVSGPRLATLPMQAQRLSLGTILGCTLNGAKKPIRIRTTPLKTSSVGHFHQKRPAAKQCLSITKPASSWCGDTLRGARTSDSQDLARDGPASGRGVH